MRRTRVSRSYLDSDLQKWSHLGLVAQGNCQMECRTDQIALYLGIDKACQILDLPAFRTHFEKYAAIADLKCDWMSSTRNNNM